MNYYKNEKGSALVFVLLLIVVFTILFVSLSSAIINNANQISKTEGNLQTTSLAEMGVNFHKARVLTNLTSVVNDPNVQSLINSQFQQFIIDLELTKEKYEENKDYYNTLINEELKVIVVQSWTAALQTMPNPNILKDIDVASSFEIRDHAATTNSQGLAVSFSSIGNNHDNTTALRTLLDIPILTSTSVFSIEFEEGDDGSQPNVPGIGTGIFDPNTFIGEPELLPQCPDNAILPDCRYIGDYTVKSGSALNNVRLHVTGSLTIPINMNNSNTGSTIWVSEDLNITQNFNSTNNVKVRVGGNATFGGNLNNMSNTIIVILKDATINGQIQNFGSDGKSILFIGGKTTTTRHFDLMKESVFYSGDDAKIGGTLTVDTDSKVCVNGRLEASSIISNNNVFARSTNHPSRVITDEAALYENCAIETIQDDIIRLIPKTSMDSDFNIDDLFDMSTEYNYIYN